MKRIFISLLTVIACSIAAMAQDSRVATLQHGTNIKAYYGPDALVEAHKGAVDGDIITLSAGQFNFTGVSKAITIRGEGRDKTALEPPTTRSIDVRVPQESSYTLALEGLTIEVPNYSLNFLGVSGTEQLLISKCRISAGNISLSSCNTVIMQSVIHQSIRLCSNANMVGINSIFYSIVSEPGRADLQNCYVGGGTFRLTYSSVKNCIISGVCSLDNTNTTSHCLVKEGSEGFADSWYIKTVAPDPDPWGETPGVVVWDNLFTSNYHLTEEAAQTYLGTDGSQVGIYGGMYPYDTTPDYPVVKSLDVIGSHKDGKLNIQINVE